MSVHKKLLQVLNSCFLMVLVFTLPSASLCFELCGIGSNFQEFWVIALGSTPTLLQSDIDPSCI